VFLAQSLFGQLKDKRIGKMFDIVRSSMDPDVIRRFATIGAVGSGRD